MKVSTYKRQQRHLRARRAYWASVYTQGGLRRVPMPFVECYSEEGEIVPLPPIKWNMGTPFLNLIPRQPSPGLPVVEWKLITEYVASQSKQELGA